ncbi:YihY/virulence factor BrkB family protein [Limimaricola sp. G21655-S1]|uniref:YihY/virulence factor BrkB family protein n=1 Tax=unclassified Limimaricola TaxID=2626459 RepID=UPI0022B028B9|nr:YihY/virulence factor BrkB family protein [Limimaricola sp. G21655-S1]MCZ4261151.1 YihY/virulence factor BrkB family protein [Limimaricola sp. G21655-S1]
MAHAKNPDAHPGDINKPGWFATLKRVYSEIGDDHVSLIAAGCAFYGLLAIFPGIVAAMAIAGLFFEPSTVVNQLESLSGFLPQQAAEIVLGQAQEVAGSEEGGLGLAAVFGILVAIYSASKGVQSLMEGLNVAFEAEESRGLVKFNLVKLALTLGMILGFLLIVAVAALLPAVLGVLPWGATTELIINIVRWPVLLVFVALGLAILYRYGPDRGEKKWRWITPGAALACLLWLVGSLGFAFYVRNFGGYNETFGALGGVIVLLMWLWLSSFIVLMGAEFDSEMERQAKHDPQPEDARNDPLMEDAKAEAGKPAAQS